MTEPVHIHTWAEVYEDRLWLHTQPWQRLGTALGVLGSLAVGVGVVGCALRGKYLWSQWSKWAPISMVAVGGALTVGAVGLYQYWRADRTLVRFSNQHWPDLDAEQRCEAELMTAQAMVNGLSCRQQAAAFGEFAIRRLYNLYAEAFNSDQVEMRMALLRNVAGNHLILHPVVANSPLSVGLAVYSRMVAKAQLEDDAQAVVTELDIYAQLQRHGAYARLPEPLTQRLFVHELTLMGAQWIKAPQEVDETIARGLSRLPAERMQTALQAVTFYWKRSETRQRQEQCLAAWQNAIQEQGPREALVQAISQRSSR